MEIRRITWVTVLAVLTGVLLVFSHLSTDNVDFSQYNTGWNGTSRFFDQASGALLIQEPGALVGYRNATLLVIAPAGNYTPEETLVYRDFLAQGNRIVLFDDFGTGDQLLSGVGSAIRLPGTALASADQAFENASLVRVYPEGNSSLVRNISGLTLNGPGSVEGGTPFLSSSLFTWEDANGDFRLDRNETLGRFTVGASEQRGGGELVVIGDPSILINGMAGVDPGNERFISGLLGSASTTLIDMTHSRTSGNGSMGGIIHMIQTTTLIQTIVLIAIAVAVAATFRRKDH